MKPLAGLRVGVTRPSHQASELVTQLEDVGATAVEVSAIEIVEPDDHGKALRACMSEFERYDWAVFTSTNAVEPVRKLAGARRPKRIAAIGSGTASALEGCGFDVDLIPKEFVAESLVEAFPVGNGRVLFASAAVVRNVLPEGLREKGWTVDVVTAYKTIDKPLPNDVDLDAITFTSSSTVRSFVEHGGQVPPIVACIGPITAATAEELGISVTVVAKEHTISGLVQALTVCVGSTA